MSTRSWLARRICILWRSWPDRTSASTRSPLPNRGVLSVARDGAESSLSDWTGDGASAKAVLAKVYAVRVHAHEVASDLGGTRGDTTGRGGCPKSIWCSGGARATRVNQHQLQKQKLAIE
jgi:hypothetical protein